MMIVIEAQRILNDNDSGKLHSAEEASCVLKLCSDLVNILEDHPIKMPLENLHK